MSWKDKMNELVKRAEGSEVPIEISKEELGTLERPKLEVSKEETPDEFFDRFDMSEDERRKWLLNDFLVLVKEGKLPADWVPPKEYDFELEKIKEEK